MREPSSRRHMPQGDSLRAGVPREAPVGCIHIVGVGNPYRGDDDAGPAVVRALHALPLPLPDAVTLTHADDPLLIIDLLCTTSALIVIDAVATAAPAGTMHRFDARTQRLPHEYSSCSTHAFGVGEAIELARALGTLPQHVTVYGIVGRCFGVGDALSPEVERAVEQVAAAVMQEVSVLTEQAR